MAWKQGHGVVGVTGGGGLRREVVILAAGTMRIGGYEEHHAGMDRPGRFNDAQQNRGQLASCRGCATLGDTSGSVLHAA